MTSYRIICCNCYFDRYLSEINENPQLLTFEEEHLKTFSCLRDRRSSENAWHLENWYHFHDDRIFHACHKCIFNILLFTKFGRYDFAHHVHCHTINFYQPKNCFQKFKMDFGCSGLKNFSHSCQFEFCLKIINNEFNCLDTNLVIKK